MIGWITAGSMVSIVGASAVLWLTEIMYWVMSLLLHRVGSGGGQPLYLGTAGLR